MNVGAGNQYRCILVKNKRDFLKAYIKKLLKEAYASLRHRSDRQVHLPPLPNTSRIKTER